MAPSPFFSGRIPQNLHDAIEKRIAETGESKTNILVNALAAYLEHQIEPIKTTSNSVEERLAQLEQRLEVIDELSKEVASLRQMFNASLEEIDNTIDNKLGKIDNTPSPGQLSLLDVEKASDNKAVKQTDNTPDSPQKEHNHQKQSDDEWDFIGRMNGSELAKLDEFSKLEPKKVKQFIRNANLNKDKTKVADDIRFTVVGQEGPKNQFIFDVFRKRPASDWV